MIGKPKKNATYIKDTKQDKNFFDVYMDVHVLGGYHFQGGVIIFPHIPHGGTWEYDHSTLEMIHPPIILKNMTI